MLTIIKSKSHKTKSMSEIPVGGTFLFQGAYFLVVNKAEDCEECPDRLILDIEQNRLELIEDNEEVTLVELELREKS